MSFNLFGELFRFSTWGESHGVAIGCVVDGVPPGLKLGETDIQVWLDKRRTGQSRFTSQRREPDKARILSGVFEGRTTGTPISIIIDNKDHRGRDYDEIKDKFRPGHADYTYWVKYGVRDYRGGGRSSARETAMRVVAGAIARKVLVAEISSEILIRGALVQIGPHSINRESWDWESVSEGPLFCPDRNLVKTWETYLDEMRKSGTSAGAIIEVVASGVPPGLGEPVYGKLDAELAGALMSINAVKGVEVGAGFGSAELSGVDNVDEIRMDNDGKINFLSNNAGGILGGISTGQDVVVRFAVKPTSSILQPVRTINMDLEDTEISTKGRHDPCVGIRAVPVGEAMVACVLADHWLRHKAQCKKIDGGA